MTNSCALPLAHAAEQLAADVFFYAEVDTALQGLKTGLSARGLAELGNRRDLFEDVAAFEEKYFNVTVQGAAFRAWGGIMSHKPLSLLGIAPVAGCTFALKEQTSGAPVVLVGELFWRTRFASWCSEPEKSASGSRSVRPRAEFCGWCESVVINTT